MLVTQCPRCQESVSVPDSLCTSSGVATSVQAQCPWCLATLGAHDLRAIVPPALVILGEEGELQSVGVSGEDWTDQSGADEGLGIASGSVANAAAGLGISGPGVGGPGIGSLGDVSGLTSDSSDAVAELPDLDFESDDSPLVVESRAEDVEDFEPIDFGIGEDSASDDGDSSDDSDMFASSSDDAEVSDLEISELGEFEVADANHPHRSAEQDSGVLAPVMMDVDSTRRRKSGGGIKTMLGVGLGGLMALPIVGLILHFLGKPVPVMGDFLESYIPMKNKAVVSRAAAPMSIDPPVVLDNQPMRGRSLADEMSAEEINPGGFSPADSALAELGMDDPGDPAPIPESSGFSLPENPAPTGGESTSVDLPMNDFGADNLPDMGLDSSPAGEMPIEIPAGEALPDAASDLFGAEPKLEADIQGPDMENTGVDPVATDLFGSPAEPAPIDDLFGEAAESEPEPSKPAEVPAAITEVAYDVQAVAKRLTQSVESIGQMQGSATERDAAVNDLFEGLSELAANSSEDSIEPARPVLQAIASDMSLVKAFALAAPDWIGKSIVERENDGALVVGKFTGTPEKPTIFLSSAREVAVSLPADQTTLPQGIQIGLGKLEGEGSGVTISLSMLQGL